jgi:hypothetical protein
MKGVVEVALYHAERRVYIIQVNMEFIKPPLPVETSG